MRSFHLFDKSNYLLAIIYYMIALVKEISQKGVLVAA